MLRFLKLSSIAGIGWLVAAQPLLAHGGNELGPDDLWTAWGLRVDIVLPTLLLLLVYLRGMAKRRTIKNKVNPWRHVAFFAGTAAVFLALQSPIDPFAERAFWIHQVQHFLLRMAGPMLLALSASEGVLVAGLPRWARRTVLRPIAQSGAMRGLTGVLSNGVVVFTLFMLSLYVWEVPAIHDAALLNPYLHYLMHITMLFTGMLFFWRIFSRSAPPKGLRYGMRLIMLMGSILLTILLGALTMLKEYVLYPAYDVHGRLFVQSALSDEQTGGFIIWISGSMMLLTSMFIIMFAWNRNEAQREKRRLTMPFSNSEALLYPETAEELWMKVEGPNKKLRIGLFAIPVSIFVLVMGLAFLGHGYANHVH